MLKAGISAQVIGFYSSFTQMAYLVFSMLFANAANHFPSTRRPESAMFWMQALFFALNAVLCLFPDTPRLLCILVFVLGFLTTFVGTVRDVLDYRLVIEVIPTESYSLYSAVSGIFLGVFGILPGLVLNFLYGIFEFYPVTACAFLAAGLASFGAGLANSALKPLPGRKVPEQTELSEARKPENSVREVFRRREFRRLIAANFIRGFGAGMLALLPVLAVRYAGFTEEKTVLLSSVTNAATFTSCAVYAFLRKKRMKASTLALAGAGLFVLLCAAFQGSVPIFLAFLFPAYAGYNIVCYAIPDIVYLHVEERIISAYNTWRMIFTTFGTICSSMLVGVLIDLVDGRILVAVGCASILFCCISYFRVFRE